MTDQEKRMEECHHAWEYFTTTFDDVFLRCARCGFVRLAAPGEIVARKDKPQRIFPEEDGERYGR